MAEIDGPKKSDYDGNMKTRHQPIQRIVLEGRHAELCLGMKASQTHFNRIKAKRHLGDHMELYKRAILTCPNNCDSCKRTHSRADRSSEQCDKGDGTTRRSSLRLGVDGRTRKQSGKPVAERGGYRTEWDLRETHASKPQL